MKEDLSLKLIVIFLSVAAAVCVVAALGVFGELKEPAPAIPQVYFPCEEDEVLMFDPRFGPGMVGCINVEEITR